MTSPPPTSLGGLVRHLGPGFIITATIVGSGELIVTPKLGASVGFSLLWFIVLGCVLKVFVQIQLARTAVATGRTTLDELNALPGPRWRVSWILWLWLAMYVSLVFQVSGIVGGIAGVFAELGIGGGPRAWALPVGVSCALLLASGRYGVVERGSTWMVAAFTVSALVSVGRAAVHAVSDHGVAAVERPAVHPARQLHRRLCGLRRDRRRRLRADLLPVLVPRERLRPSCRGR